MFFFLYILSTRIRLSGFGFGGALFCLDFGPPREITDMSERKPSSQLDKWGIFVSLLCGIHCLSAPLLFIFLPAFAEIWGHPLSHILIAIVILPLACTVLIKGYLIHKRRWILLTTTLGIVAVISSCILPYLVEAPPDCDTCCPQVVTTDTDQVAIQFPLASIAAITGSVLLVISHLGNLICCRKCLSVSENCCD